MTKQRDTFVDDPAPHMSGTIVRAAYVRDGPYGPDTLILEYGDGRVVELSSAQSLVVKWHQPDAESRMPIGFGLLERVEAAARRTPAYAVLVTADGRELSDRVPFNWTTGAELRVAHAGGTVQELRAEVRLTDGNQTLGWWRVEPPPVVGDDFALRPAVGEDWIVELPPR